MAFLELFWLVFPPQVKFVVDLILDLFRFPLKFKLALKVTSLDKHKDIGYSLV